MPSAKPLLDLATLGDAVCLKVSASARDHAKLRFSCLNDAMHPCRKVDIEPTAKLIHTIGAAGGLWVKIGLVDGNCFS